MSQFCLSSVMVLGARLLLAFLPSFLAARIDDHAMQLGLAETAEAAACARIEKGAMFEQYQLVRFLGAGSEGQVWLAEVLADVSVRCGHEQLQKGDEVALKIFADPKVTELRSRQEKEIGILLNVTSPNVMHGFEAFKIACSNEWVLVMASAVGLEYEKCFSNGIFPASTWGFPVCQNYKREHTVAHEDGMWTRCFGADWCRPKPKHLHLDFPSAVKTILGEIRGFRDLCKLRVSQGDNHVGNRMILETGDAVIFDFGFAKQILEVNDEDCASDAGMRKAEASKGLQNFQYEKSSGIACCSTDATQLLNDFNRMFSSPAETKGLGLYFHSPANSEVLAGLQQLSKDLMQFVKPMSQPQALLAYAKAESTAEKILQYYLDQSPSLSLNGIRPGISDYYFTSGDQAVETDWQRYLISQGVAQSEAQRRVKHIMRHAPTPLEQGTLDTIQPRGYKNAVERGSLEVVDINCGWGEARPVPDETTISPPAIESTTTLPVEASTANLSPGQVLKAARPSAAEARHVAIWVGLVVLGACVFGLQ